jgi:hypothetical protein
MERLFTNEALGFLPIGFQFFVKPPEEMKYLNNPEKRVKIDYYNTDKYKVQGYHKPISKIIKKQLWT